MLSTWMESTWMDWVSWSLLCHLCLADLKCGTLCDENLNNLYVSSTSQHLWINYKHQGLAFDSPWITQFLHCARIDEGSRPTNHECPLGVEHWTVCIGSIKKPCFNYWLHDFLWGSWSLALSRLFDGLLIVSSFTIKASHGGPILIAFIKLPCRLYAFFPGEITLL